MTKPLPSASWVSSFFDETYVNLSHDVFPKHAADFLLKEIQVWCGLSPKTFFDQCCGSGCLALQLAHHGLSGVGVDQSAVSIEKAKTSLFQTAQNHQVEFLCKDALSFVPFPKDLSVSWHTSLGYAGYASAQTLLKNLLFATAHRGVIALDIRNLASYREENPSQTVEVVLRGVPSCLHRKGRWEGQTLIQDWTIVQNERIVWEKQNATCYHLSQSEIEDFAQTHKLEVVFIPHGNLRFLVLMRRTSL